MDQPMRYHCNGPRLYRMGDEIVALTSGEIPSPEEGEYLGHQGCGDDLTSLILAIPPDGRPHVVACPVCETVGEHLRTPPDEIEV